MPEPVPPSRFPERYPMLDVWRGLAALTVVVHHIVHWFIGPWAVMAFFVISGYCITASVDACARKGVSLPGYMKRRLRRIYPPYFFCLVFFVLTRLIKRSGGGEVTDLADPVRWLQNLTLTQWLTLLRHPVAYAPQNPTHFLAAFWSLCYEEQFYLVMGLALVLLLRWRMRVETLVLILMVPALAWTALFPRLSYGVFIEYWTVFGVGSLLFYRLCRWTSRGARAAFDAAVLLAAGVAAWKLSAMHMWPDPRIPDDQTRTTWSELFIGCAFTLVLVATRRASDAFVAFPLARPLVWLGQITFSLYLIHQAAIGLGRTAIERGAALALGHERADALLSHAWLFVPAQIALQIALAAVFWYFCERPFLNTRPAAAKAGAPSPSGLAEGA